MGEPLIISSLEPELDPMFGEGIGVTDGMSISAINLGHTGNIGRGYWEEGTGQGRPKVVGYLRYVI